MIKLLLLAAFAIAAFSQTLTLTGPASARPGSTVTLNLSTTAANAAGYQWVLAIPSGFTATATAGAASTAASKTLRCNAGACVVWGMTIVPIGAGALASYTVVIPPTATGSAQFTISSASGATPAATTLPVTLGAAYTLALLDPADIDGDGRVTSADLDLAVNGILTAMAGGACDPKIDQNGDGKCDVSDAIRVLLRVLGL